MNVRRFELLEGEEVLFESGPAVLTNRRLLANWEGGDGGRASNEALLKDIASFEKINGGQDSRYKLAMQLGAIGVVLIAIEFSIPDPSKNVDALLFFFGSLGILGGAHFSLASLLRAKPQTTVLFATRSEKDVSVVFPGRDNPTADELTRRFLRAKRGL